MANHETAIQQALAKGDISGARKAYDKYEQSMKDSHVTPRSQSYFGIPS